MSGTPPTTLGKYQIIREIARSNDVVYEAYDPLMNRRVAIKELLMPQGSTSQQQEDRISRFSREARAVGTLSHANIMTVYQFERDGDRYFMAMEYLDGHTLRNEIDTQGFMPMEKAIDTATDILRGLSHAHAHGVIHRDIKPDNIQILSSGLIKITDFGIARLTFQPNLTMDGQVFGTPSYMSPEQVVGREIDQRSDLFSVGVLLYEMISGVKPFAGDSVVSITYAIMNKEPDKLSQANYAVQQVLDKALDKSPALRYSSAQEMIDALENAKKSLNAANMVIDNVQPQQPQHTVYGTVYPQQGGYQQPAPYNYNQGAYQTPVPPPQMQYPYNPYQNPQPQQPQYQQPGMQQPGLPPGYVLPQYYPPAPRPPMMSPETQVFMKRLLITLAVVSTLTFLLIVVFQSLGKAMSEGRNHQMDAGTYRQLDEEAAKVPADQVQAKIDIYEAAAAKMTSSVDRQDLNRTLAALYERLGQQQVDAKDFTNAEISYGKAIEKDPSNPMLHSNLGYLYLAQARVQGDAATAGELAQRSANEWSVLVEQVPPDKLISKYGSDLALALLECAELMNKAPEMPKKDIRQVLYSARQCAPNPSDALSRVNTELELTPN